MSAKALKKKKAASKFVSSGRIRQIAAGEFKAKCLSLIDQVNETGRELIITKRGKPTAKLIPFAAPNIDSFFGRLKGIVEIVGDPDDLVKPIIPLEDWDMLR
jgi:prevent-host-death family protein